MLVGYGICGGLPFFALSMSTTKKARHLRLLASSLHRKSNRDSTTFAAPYTFTFIPSPAEVTFREGVGDVKISIP